MALWIDDVAVRVALSAVAVERVCDIPDMVVFVLDDESSKYSGLAPGIVRQKKFLTSHSNADIDLSPQVCAILPCGRVPVIEFSGRDTVLVTDGCTIIVTRDKVVLITCVQILVR